MTTVNSQWHLVSRPVAEAQASNFRLVEAPLPALADGQVLVRHHFLSLDPYMRGRMNDAKNYAKPQPLDQVMQGGTVGEVLESRHAGYKAGDQVVGMGGWQEYSVVDAGVPGAMRKADTTHVPLSAYLGALGMPGVTAWYGLMNLIEPKAGQTIAVSAASGAVGGVVGQLAKARGCRAVGIAGGAEKCRYVVDELGFDACVDYKAHKAPRELQAAVRAVTPDGIHGCFENVGGAVMDAVMLQMADFGRIALCGMISGYDGQSIAMNYPTVLLRSRLRLEGFIVSEHMEVWPQALKELGLLVTTGKLKYRESVAPGIASAPEAFIGLLKGRNFGKQLVKLI
jgi:NADPH-dependent curcumin reductase CurA